MNQEQHHKKKTFREEYLELLNRFNIDYDKLYILKDIQYSCKHFYIYLKRLCKII